MKSIRLLVIFGMFCVFFSHVTTQQTQCGIAETFNYPIDTNSFQLVQDFGVASPRHQGRFHTGEDWFGGAGSSLGQPVRAAAAGRVTYSAPTGWGRDGGVVIIEHTLPDDSIVYTQYGHMMQTDLVTFPSRLSCVAAGDIIGAVGDARPAPHLHFEVRVASPDIPGPGYSRELPTTLEWRRPAEMVTNIQARFSRAYEWDVTIPTNQNPPPLVLDDDGMLVINGDLLRRISTDGRVLWRVQTPREAVGIVGFQANPLVIYADGTLGRVDFEGTPGQEWQLGIAPDMPPLDFENSLLLHTADNALVALSEDHREILWRLDGVPQYSHAYISPELISLVIENELWLISYEGELISKSELRDTADMATGRDGQLVVYTRGGLWQINTEGEWSPLLPEDVPPGGGSGAVKVTDDGRVYLTDGTNIYAYNRLGESAWQASLPFPVQGETHMAYYNGVLLILSNRGDLIAVQENGGICGFNRVYGDGLSDVWHELSDDGILRIAVGNSYWGLDWERFTNGC